jgi:hypothetical protein
MPEAPAVWLERAEGWFVAHVGDGERILYSGPSVRDAVEVAAWHNGRTGQAVAVSGTFRGRR